MGPPLKAAENLPPLLEPYVLLPASMGPPLKAAENKIGQSCGDYRRSSFNGAAAKSSGKCRGREGWRCRETCFNGAAAKSSGKFEEVGAAGHFEAASMGPPLKAAENLRGRRSTASLAGGLQWGRR